MGGLVLYKFEFNPRILKQYFDIKVREQCKSCKRYGVKASCPPYCETMEYYQRLLPKYKYGELIVLEYPIEDRSKWAELGKCSSQEISNEIIKYRNRLIELGFYFVVGFTAGSCKNCDKCSIPCRLPDKSLVPLEATGIDVVKLAKKIAKVRLHFPVTDKFYRIGMILYG